MGTAVEYQVSARCYNDLFFHPSVCHVCKYLSRKDMIRCDCGMLSYCSEEHMAMDRVGSDENVGHGEICDIIKRLIRRGSMRVFPGGEHHEWIEQKCKYMKIVEEKLRREMMPHERRMLLFTRCCVVCRKDAELQSCKECYSVDYCEQHYDEGHRKKDSDNHQCLQLKQWLYFEMKATNVHPIPQWRTFHDFPNKGDVNDMFAFFKEYVAPIKYAGCKWMDLIYSDCLSWPLTTYDVLRKVNLLNDTSSKSTYVIHIVEASNVDKVYLPCWEVFLHVFQNSVKLIVIMIGPDLATDLAGTSGKFQTCWEKCISLGRELYFQYHRMSYHEYADSELYKEPDVVIGYQVNFNDNQILAQCVTVSLRSVYCPIILTAKSLAYAVKLRNEINQFLNKHKEPDVEHNQFRSYRPYRDYTTGRIYYRNEYRIVLRNLKSKSYHCRKPLSQ